MKAAIVALTGLALLATALGKPSASNGRIIGGDDAKLGQFPWQISMDAGWSGHICGGSILSEKWVITAAHCIDAVGSASAFTVRAGLINLNSNSEQERNAVSVTKHPDWDSWEIVNDLALIELATPFEFDANVQPITLGAGLTPSPDAFKCIASGWGATDGNGWNYPNDLQYLDVTFYTDDKCAGHWNPVGVNYNPNSHMCAGKDNGDSVCFGDSGGPLVCQTTKEGDENYYLFGATSFGNNPCGQPAYPAVWTDLTNFMEWIESKTGPLLRPLQ
jgi:secreted trypsin-like serine protease